MKMGIKQQPKQQAKITKKIVIYGGGTICAIALIIGIFFALNIGQVQEMLGKPPGKDYQTIGSGSWDEQFNWGKGKKGKGKGGYPDNTDETATIQHDIQLSNFNPDVKSLTMKSGGSLKIDKGQKLTVHEEISFSGGTITTSDTSSLVIKDGATIKGMDSSHYIDGPYQMQGSDSMVFKVEGKNKLSKVAVHSIQNQSSFSVNQVSKDPNKAISGQLNLPLEFISHYEYFEIKRTSGSGAAKVTLFWDQDANFTDFSNVNQMNAITVAHYNDSTGEWENMGQAKMHGTQKKGYVTSKTLSKFSPFTFGSTSASSPLPVELMYFKVLKDQKNEAQLTWATASETNNSHFEIQKSDNGEDFRKIGEVEGHGSTTEKHKYSFSDRTIGGKTVYYRLKQVDYDGSHEFSNVKTLALTEKEERASLSFKSIRPNPFRNDFKAEFTGTGKTAQIMLRNQNGQKVYMKTVEAKGGTNEFHFKDGRLLDNGIYTLIIKSGSAYDVRKLVKR